MSWSYYTSKAARRLLSDHTLWWRVVVLSAIQLVPLVGSVAITGYEMMVMRDATLGSGDRLPSWSESGEIAQRGLRGLAVSFVWSLPLICLLLGVAIGWTALRVSASLGGPPSVRWFTYGMAVPLAFISIYLNVALVRSAVYSTVSAGLSLRGVRELIASNRDRFKYVAWTPIALVLLGLALSLLGSLATEGLELSLVAATLMTYVSRFLIGLVQVPAALVVAGTYGLWAAETDPATWPALGDLKT